MSAPRVDLSSVRRQAGSVGGRQSGETRRQQRDESIVVQIRIIPAHRLSPAQLAAWRSFWRAILAAEPELPAPTGSEAGDGE